MRAVPLLRSLPFLLALLAACGGSTGAVPAAGTDAGAPDAAAPPADAAPVTCSPSSVAGIALATSGGPNPLDPLGYPPYALDGCALLYVAPTGELLFRDLASGAEARLAAAEEAPRRPAVANGLMAWEATAQGKRVVRVVANGGAAVTLPGSGMAAIDHAGEPRVTEGAVVFTGWLGAADTSDTDVFLYTPADGKTTTALGGPGQQRFADVSADKVAVTDFSPDPAGVFDPSRLCQSDVVIVDRATLAATPRPLPGQEQFPILSGSHVVYLHWLIHPEPKLSQYALMVGDVGRADATQDANVKDVAGALVETNTPYVRPSVHKTTLEWVDDVAGGLFRRPVDLSAAAVNPASGFTMVAAVATDAMTVVTTPQGTAMVLRAVPR
jgi:hypothetical protein